MGGKWKQKDGPHSLNQSTAMPPCTRVQVWVPRPTNEPDPVPALRELPAQWRKQVDTEIRGALDGGVGAGEIREGVFEPCKAGWGWFRES